MKTNVDNTPSEELRTLAQHLLQTYDKCAAILDGTIEHATYDDAFKQTEIELVRLANKVGLYCAVPLFLEVEREYRQQNPATAIPLNAFGTLLHYDAGDEYDFYYSGEQYDIGPIELRVPLCEHRGWGLSIAVMSLPPEVAKCIQGMPWKCSTKVDGYSCETFLYDLIETLVEPEPADLMQPHFTEAFEILYRLIRNGEPIPSEIVVPLEDDNDLTWKTAGLLDAAKRKLAKPA